MNANESPSLSLRDELELFRAVEMRAWLERALAGREIRLEIDRDEGPELAVARLKDELRGDSRELLRQAVGALLAESIDGARSLDETESAEHFDALLYLVHVFEPADSGTRLRDLALDASRFDTLPTALQFSILNTLEDLPEPVPGFWESLAARDPSRFGVSAFGALWRTNIDAALSVLGMIKPTAGQLKGLDLRVAGLIRQLEPSCRPKILRRVSETLSGADEDVRATLRAAFEREGCPLPVIEDRPQGRFDLDKAFAAMGGVLSPAEPGIIRN